MNFNESINSILIPKSEQTILNDLKTSNIAPSKIIEKAVSMNNLEMLKIGFDKVSSSSELSSIDFNDLLNSKNSKIREYSKQRFYDFLNSDFDFNPIMLTNYAEKIQDSNILQKAFTSLHNNLIKNQIPYFYLIHLPFIKLLKSKNKNIKEQTQQFLINNIMFFKLENILEICINSSNVDLIKILYEKGWFKNIMFKSYYNNFLKINFQNIRDKQAQDIILNLLPEKYKSIAAYKFKRFDVYKPSYDFYPSLIKIPEKELPDYLSSGGTMPKKGFKLYKLLEFIRDNNPSYRDIQKFAYEFSNETEFNPKTKRGYYSTNLSNKYANYIEKDDNGKYKLSSLGYEKLNNLKNQLSSKMPKMF